ncbi:MAG: His/Gly/Thr/Pro-type tRNA ligase C-terminal domain-containing protein, partial [Candidatus Thermoplasmatota archaeon]|nr:His/Gly/Thr/Pro-type tRNA ligase C-terminal domain-containing protein [Candidatus Thermoplasmatota archaeon]
PILLESDRGTRILRHSAAHLLAQAVTEIFPDAKPNAGPPTEDGFYYDIEMKAINQEELENVEKRMREIISRNLKINREVLSKADLLKKFSHNPYKIDKINENVPDGGFSSVYSQGGFTDFCKGPHLPSTGYLRAVKLLSVASTHYKADATRPMLVRIYGTAFPDDKSLKEYLRNREEAMKRDHRKIAQEMDLLVFNSERAPGFPLYTPNGLVLKQELMEFMKRLNRKHGWQEVATPHIYRDTIWKQSGHYAKYKPDMFLFTLEDGDSYGIKPMNCPGHITIFEREPKSYRDLPVKYCEAGTVYRYEKSGEVGGLTRPRMFTIDDGHAFLRLDQIVSEVRDIMSMIKETFSTILGEAQLTYDLSVIDRENPGNYLITYKCASCGTATETRRESTSGEFACPNCSSTDLTPDFSTWDQATDQLRSALESEGLKYSENPGEAAFYGPKIDVHVKDALGRMWQLSTVQVDFFMPTNFGLYYINSESKHDRILMIHRAVFGSYERFMAILIENFAGKFPAWLAPLQVYIVPVSEKYNDYAQKVHADLVEEGIRSRIDTGSETISKKIKLIRKMRPPYILVIGEKEQNDGTVSVRNRSDKQSVMTVDEFLRKLKNEIRSYSLDQSI